MQVWCKHADRNRAPTPTNKSFILILEDHLKVLNTIDLWKRSIHFKYALWANTFFLETCIFSECVSWASLRIGAPHRARISSVSLTPANIFASFSKVALQKSRFSTLCQASLENTCWSKESPQKTNKLRSANFSWVSLSSQGRADSPWAKFRPTTGAPHVCHMCPWLHSLGRNNCSSRLTFDDLKCSPHGQSTWMHYNT